MVSRSHDGTTFRTHDMAESAPLLSSPLLSVLLDFWQIVLPVQACVHACVCVHIKSQKDCHMIHS